MIGDLSTGGVYVPALLVMALLALAVTGIFTQLLRILGLYRIIAYRPAVDLSIFILIVEFLVLVTMPRGWLG